MLFYYDDYKESDEYLILYEDYCPVCFTPSDEIEHEDGTCTCACGYRGTDELG